MILVRHPLFTADGARMSYRMITVELYWLPSQSLDLRSCWVVCSIKSTLTVSYWAIPPNSWLHINSTVCSSSNISSTVAI